MSRETDLIGRNKFMKNFGVRLEPPSVVLLAFLVCKYIKISKISQLNSGARCLPRHQDSTEIVVSIGF